MNQICKHCGKELVRPTEIKDNQEVCVCYASVKVSAIKEYDRRPASRKAATKRKAGTKKASKKKK